MENGIQTSFYNICIYIYIHTTTIYVRSEWIESNGLTNEFVNTWDVSFANNSLLLFEHSERMHGGGGGGMYVACGLATCGDAATSSIFSMCSQRRSSGCSQRGFSQRV